MNLEKELILSLSWIVFLLWILWGNNRKIEYSFDIIGFLALLWFDIGWLSFSPKKGKLLTFSFFYRIVFWVFSFSLISFLIIYLKALYSYKIAIYFLESAFYVSFISFIGLFIPVKPFFLGNVVASYVQSKDKILLSLKVRFFLFFLSFVSSFFLKHKAFIFTKTFILLIKNVLDK